MPSSRLWHVRTAPWDSCCVGIRAVAFDVGGVLRQVGRFSDFQEIWQERLGMTPAEFGRALATVDPDGLAFTGRLSQAQFKARHSDALRLSAEQADRFMADLWAVDSGELDAELVAYVASLRPRYKTAILSDAIDGARPWNQERYGFEQLVDVIIYSYEVGLAKPDPRIYRLLCDRLTVSPGEVVFLDDRPENVRGAHELGIQALLHKSTAQSIKAVDALLARQDTRSPRRSLAGFEGEEP
jgi:epoxide hydrolase-like predicted phosphatase